jgi:phosphoglycolate phosphatase-like HAD superfamily hydrolase
MSTAEGKNGSGGTGVEIPPEERTPLVEKLLRMIVELKEENRALRDEVNQLKGQTRRPQIRPSTLHQERDPQAGGKTGKRRKRKGKRPGSAKRHKTRELRIDETIPLVPDDLPPGAVLESYQDFVVQDLLFESHNVKYRRARFRLPDGAYLTAPLPETVRGHFGFRLRGYVLHQHHQNHVTQPLIRQQLLDVGVDISVGEINEMLLTGHEVFHEEKDQLLPAALEVSAYLNVDDTGARHQGRNGYCTHIGNEFFASFTSTPSKSRINFLRLLQAPRGDHVLNGDALFAMECYGLPQDLLQCMAEVLAEGPRVFSGVPAWEQWLAGIPIRTEDHRRIVTEAVLWASLMYHDTIMHQVLISDDAPQFKVLGLMNALCWVHAERGIDRLLPVSDAQRRAQEQVQDEVWQLYQQLKAYRTAPKARRSPQLRREFERIFTQTTCFPELNVILGRLHAKQEYLLLVLDRPEIPLHNNLSENDIRDYVKKRRISAGTRSDLGRRCRDTFLSLKKTCRKLGVSFWEYLQDRLLGRGVIPPLPDLIRRAALSATGP